MIKKNIVLAMLFTGFTAADAKIKIGLRGGLNVTNMTFNQELLDANNRTGFYLGPTIKVDLPLGVDIDVSLLYNQFEADSELYVEPGGGKFDYDDKFPSLKRKTLALPINIRKGFGFGDSFDVFVFAGPQFDFNLGGDLEKYHLNWEWRSSAFSINLGAGMMLMNHLEARVNYNIACGTAGEFKAKEALDAVGDAVTGKTGGWQIGLAYYF